MVDTGAVTDDLGEWLEVYNPSGTKTYDLFGCTIADISHVDTITRHLMVAPGAFITMARFADISGGFVPDFSYPTVKFGNAPTGDAATLRCGSTIVDRVDFQIGFTITKGRSLSLSPMHYNASDNDLPINWCAATTAYHTVGGTTDFGSPGVSNPPCP